MIQKMKKDWNELAEYDACWAILSEKDKRGCKWDKDEFYATGKEELNDILEKLDYKICKDDNILDIGCGAGRMTIAFSKIAGKAYGVDVSEKMIEIARKMSRDFANTYYYVNNGGDLSMLKENFFDFIFSIHVFQHIQSKEVIFNYLSEIKRILKPGKIAFIHIPTKSPLINQIQPKRKLFYLLRVIGLPALFLQKIGLTPIGMFHVPNKLIQEYFNRLQLSLIKVLNKDSVGTIFIFKKLG